MRGRRFLNLVVQMMTMVLFFGLVLPAAAQDARVAGLPATGSAIDRNREENVRFWKLRFKGGMTEQQKEELAQYILNMFPPQGLCQNEAAGNRDYFEIEQAVNDPALSFRQKKEAVLRVMIAKTSAADPPQEVPYPASPVQARRSLTSEEEAQMRANPLTHARDKEKAELREREFASLKELYAKLHDAMLSGDVDTQIQYSTSAQRQKFEQARAMANSPFFKWIEGMAQKMMPKTYAIDNVELDHWGDSATLYLRSTDEQHPGLTAESVFRKEPDGWKMEKTSWKDPGKIKERTIRF